MLQATPASWRMLLEAGWRGDGKLKALCGGEALPADLARRLGDAAGEVWNMYGPTETTIWSTLHRVAPGEEPVPIGRPIDETPVYVLDSHQALCPIGVPGELCIGGAGVANGYFRRADLTKERFLADPWGPQGSRLYRTGDLARMRADGVRSTWAGWIIRSKSAGSASSPGRSKRCSNRAPR
jgi:non-ribosomal peptide synthetase component F